MQTVIKYNLDEETKIQKTFPDLFFENTKTIKGELSFCARYKENIYNNISKFIIESCEKNADGFVKNVYSIKIDLNSTDISNLPKVFETEGQIKNLAISLGKTLDDLHLNKDESCCLGIFSHSDQLSLSDFVLERVYPYFVWQAYFAKHREIPPCGACPHDRLAAIKSRIEDEENNHKLLCSTLKNNPTGKIRNKSCPCGSGKKYKKCCFESDKEKKSEINKIDNRLLHFKNLEKQKDRIEKQ